MRITSELLDIDSNKGAIVRSALTRKSIVYADITIGEGGSMSTVAVVVIIILSVLAVGALSGLVICYIRRRRFKDEV